ncbi:hypothetical protein Tco_0874418, partial [Tanacetum coccineum]
MYTMTDVDVNAPAKLAPTIAPPTRTDDQILPHIRWVPIGKRNCYLDVDRPQSNPIFKIAMDLLMHTNFFRAFTASSAIPAIYIQQFWDTIRYDKIVGGYKCQLDEQWFDLSKDTLRDALQITPVDRNNAFSSPPTSDALIKFVNDLGYPKVVRHLSDVVTNDMFQPWRALTTVINLCLTGKTSGFERPRALVLQILWGVINQAHINYAERMWEEFTQSIHTFIEDKKNLAQHTHGKKKVTLIVIPSIRFTKLIIHYLQSKHKFHARPGSPLHLPNEEPVFGYLKFSSKGTKREVFGMPIPNDLITDDIRGKQYYNAYLEKVAKHQRYLAGEDVSDPDSPAPKPTKGAKPKTTKKPTSTQQTKPKTKPSIAKTTKSTPSQPPKPKPAPAKPQEKKRKRALDAAEAPSLAKRSKAGRVSKKRTLQLRDEFIDEGVPATEPRVDDEEAIVQKVLEESMKDAYPAHRGPLPPVVFREPDSGKLQPLPEVQGKGKEKVGEEQAAQVLLNLQTPKKKNPAEQFIFQRRTPATAEPSGLVESSSLYAELGLTDSGTESDEEVSPEMNAQGQEEGQGGTNPGDAGVSQTPSSHVVHAGPNLDHMDLGIAEASSQPNTEQMDDEFTATAYPKVQENLKLPTEGEVRLEEPASSAGTLSSMKNLDKDLSFTDQFLVEKSQEDEPEKTNTEAEVQSMVTVPIHQDTSSVPLMTTPYADTMTDVDVNAPAELAPTMAPPTRTDDQILPHIRWVPIGKSNCYLDVDRPQSNPIFKITVDLLKHTNFFRAFTASSAIPAIYIQQFWDTIRYDKIITPVDRNNAFSSPPTPDALIKFVNDLGYPKVVRHLSDVVTNDMFQPWRALTTIINLCLTGKTSGFERPRAPVLQILWGVINRAHIDHAERTWEEFTQFEDKRNLAQHTQGKKKVTLIVILSIRFTKLIIHYLQSKHKFHTRPGSPLHLPNEEHVLGYLNFSFKGTKREVFGMPIPNDLVTDDIR